MNYMQLAAEFMESMQLMRQKGAHKHLSESIKGETFVLRHIALHDGDLQPSELSQQVGVSSARIANTLNSLEDKGLIARQIHEDDRRRIKVVLTPAGEEYAKKSHKIVVKTTADMLEFLGERDAKEYVRITHKLAQAPPPKDIPQEP